MAEGFKYALLLASHPRGPENPVELATGVWASNRSVESLVPNSAVDHWRTFLGSREWDELTKPQLMVDVRLSSLRAEVLDAEHQQLEHFMSRVRLGLLLAGPVALCFGATRILSGQAMGARTTDGLLDIRQIPVRGEMVVLPYCTQVEGFWISRPRDVETGWVARWQEMIGLLSAAEGEASPLLSFGLLAFSRAFSPRHIEFKIPDCVRATEAVVGLPRVGGGQRTFARRALELAPELMHDWFVGGTADEVRERLEQLYVLRNECVHGKVPFESLMVNGVHNAMEAARFEYLAETVARSALVRALRSTLRKRVFVDRATLEAAWTNNLFPQP